LQKPNIEKLNYLLCPKGRKHIARGEAPGQRNNTHKKPQRGERKREFSLAGTFTSLGIHYDVIKKIYLECLNKCPFLVCFLLK
jgi:hypothetical protein